MSGKFVTLSPKAIVVCGLQVRLHMDRAHVDDIAELFDEDNPVWPDGLLPVIVFYDGKSYFLADGHHRLTAAMEKGCTEIRVEVRRGSMNDALLYACGANAAHGLKRTAEDKRNAVRIAYSIDPTLPQRNIARLCKVSLGLASTVIKSLTANKTADNADSKNDKSKKSEQSPQVETNQENTETVSKCEETGEGVHLEQNGPASPLCSKPEALPSANEYDKIDSLIGELITFLDAVGKQRGGELLRSNYLKLKIQTVNGASIERLYSTDLENLRRELKHWRPHSPRCPVCDGIPAQSCNLCYGLPYLTRGAFERLTPEQRAKLERSPHDAA